MSQPNEADHLCSLADIRNVLQDAEEQWRSLESCLQAVEEETFRTHSSALKDWFCCTDRDLESWAEGGLRRRVRRRIGRLMLGPFAERMRKAVDFAPSTSGVVAADVEVASVIGHVCSAESGVHILDELRAHLEQVANTSSSCDRTTGKERSSHRGMHRGKHSRGHASTGTGHETTAQRSAVKALSLPIMRLAAFVESNVSSSTGAILNTAVPAAIARAVCDFYFYGYEAQFRQLQAWWDNAKDVLQQQCVWNRLQQDEGLFIRRIERGIDALDAARRRYEAFADFGASEFDIGIIGVTYGNKTQPMEDNKMKKASADAWPSEAISLLASAVSDFRTRLKPIRDCAAWRVVEAVKTIRAELNEHVERTAAPSIWDSIGWEMGVVALSSALDASTSRGIGSSEEAVSHESSDPVNAALVFMQRLDRLAAIIGELQDSFRQESYETGAIRDFLDEVLGGVSSTSEELLAVLDDPSLDALATCVQLWDSFCEAIDGEKLSVAMASVPMHSAGAEKQEARRHRFTLLKGMQGLLEDKTIRRKLTIMPAATHSQRCQAWTEERLSGTPLVPLLSPPPAEAMPAIESPRASYFLQQAKCDAKSEEQPTVRKETARDAVTRSTSTAASDKSPAATMKGIARSRSVAVLPSSSASRAGSKTPAGARSTSKVMDPLRRPTTPSWLQPPWPRPNTPSATTWARPDTPSTACDETEATVPSLLPRWKFVNGECVLRRPSSAALLPPLNSMVPAAARDWPRPAW